MVPIDKYLFEDIQTAKKIKENPEYYDKLEVAYKIVKDLKIISQLQYYAYAIVITAFENIPYIDIQAFERFQNPDYYKYVQDKMIDPKHPKFKVIK